MESYRVTRYVRNDAGDLVVWVPPWKVTQPALPGLPKKRLKKISTLNKLRKTVYDRDGNRCAYCGCRKQLTLDHKKPLSKGGTNSLDNLQTLCSPCNQMKGDKYPFVPKIGKTGKLHNIHISVTCQHVYAEDVAGEYCARCGMRTIN